jgi:hypothetical protein
MSSSIEEKTVTKPGSPESTTHETPNVFLVESLVQVILSLSQKERELLEEKLNRKKNWQETLKQIREHKAAIHAEREGKQPPIDEIIHQMREERTEQLMQASFPGSEKK